MTHILITNDDGITAPGLHTLVQEMRKIGEISVLAPDRNWSASGHVKTMHRPLRVNQVQVFDGISAHATDGAPSDCVTLALLGYISQSIDLVISGINPNANIGHDVTYSGTVTAAMEAVIRGIPGIAVSLDSPDNHSEAIDYYPAASVSRQISEQLLKFGFPQKTVININVPYLPVDQIKGIRITRQGRRIYREQLLRRMDPRNQPYYWIGGDTPTGLIDECTVYESIKCVYISITPLKLDLTSYKEFETFGNIDWELDGVDD